MTIEARARRVDAAIEATPGAVNWRSEALALLAEGKETLAILAAFSAAECVLEAVPTVGREIEPAGLRSYIWRQVVALTDGGIAVMDLRPID